MKEKKHGMRIFQEANHASRWFIISRITLAFSSKIHVSHINFVPKYESLLNTFPPAKRGSRVC